MFDYVRACMRAFLPVHKLVRAAAAAVDAADDHLLLVSTLCLLAKP